MKICFVIASLLLVHVCMCQATRRLNSRQFRWEDSDSASSQRGSQPAPYENARDERKILFINNIAYDLTEDEMKRVWDAYDRDGQFPDMEMLKRQPNMDSLSAVMNSPVTDKTTATPKASVSHDQPSQNFERVLSNKMVREEPVNKMDDDQEVVNKRDNSEPVKASRFVADPKKQHLIQKVDEEELKDLRKSTATPAPVERVVTEATVDTSTVRYEFTQVNALTYLWNEFKNIGDLLGREMIGSVSGTLYYLWESVVRYVTNRSRRAIQDMSSEL